VTWIKKKIGPGIYNITTVDDAERLLTSETKLVLGFLNSLVVRFAAITIFRFGLVSQQCILVLFHVFQPMICVTI
jgi:hypothetical protein